MGLMGVTGYIRVRIQHGGNLQFRESLGRALVRNNDFIAGTQGGDLTRYLGGRIFARLAA